MAFFENPQQWRTQEIHHIDPRSLPPLRREDEEAFHQMARKQPDEGLPWVVPIGENPPWLVVPFPPLLKYPPFPGTPQNAVKTLLALTGISFLLMLIWPSSGGCFLVSLIFLLVSFFYLKRISLPDFVNAWNHAQSENSRNQKEWQRERCLVTKQWLSEMEHRRELWKKMMILDADRHFSQGDQFMKELVSGKNVDAQTVRTIEKARIINLRKRAKDAERLKDYTTAARYYHKAGDEENARKLHEMSHGTRQYVQVGSIDQSIKITDSVVQRSTIGGDDECPVKSDLVNVGEEKEHAGGNRPVSIVEHLSKLQKLRERGALSDEEFEKAKLKLFE